MLVLVCVPAPAGIAEPAGCTATSQEVEVPKVPLVQESVPLDVLNAPADKLIGATQFTC